MRIENCTYSLNVLIKTLKYDMLTIIQIGMAGRPKNPNRPPTITAVRITERTREKLIKLHSRWGSKEPYNNTIERALDEAEYLRKKVNGLQLVIEDLELEIESKGQGYFKLFAVKEEIKHKLELLEKQRSQLLIKKSMR